MLNDPTMQLLVKDYVADVANDLDGASERSEIKVDLVDRAAMLLSGSIAVAGIVALAGSGSTAAPFLLAGGLIGMTAGGVGRTWLRDAGATQQGVGAQGQAIAGVAEMTTDMLLISVAVAAWSVLLVVVTVYVDDATRSSALRQLVVSFATLPANQRKLERQ